MSSIPPSICELYPFEKVKEISSEKLAQNVSTCKITSHLDYTSVLELSFTPYRLENLNQSTYELLFYQYSNESQGSSIVRTT